MRSQWRCGQSLQPLRVRRAMAAVRVEAAIWSGTSSKKTSSCCGSFILLAALLHWIDALVYYQRGLFSNDVTLEMLSEWVPELALFASMFLIAAIVHLDAIPGVRQDWLIRPVPRGALLLEKFLFVLVAVEGPVFVANLAEGLADGFSLQSSLSHALGFVTVVLFFLVLPIFAFASVTRNMTQAFILGCGCTFIIGTFLILAGPSMLRHTKH